MKFDWYAMLKKPDILSQIQISPRVDLPRSRLRSPLGMALVAAPMMAAVAAFALVPQNLATPQGKLVEQSVALAPVRTGDAALFSRTERMLRGDTAAAALARLAINDTAAARWLRSNPAGQQLGRLPTGALLHARVDDAGLLHELRFRIATEREIVIRRTADGFASEERQPLLQTRLETRSGIVRGSLFGALDEAGVPDEYARQLIDIFSGDIDFHHGLKRGDRFSVAYEVHVDDYGSTVGAGRLLAASFVNGGEEHSAFAFNLADGKTEYFSPDGASLKRAFLKNPVELSRISSGFSTARMHPVLQTLRAHKGVDYAAPIGSKVMATADGVVAFAGVQGGYGNVIILKHDKTYSTVYGHLNGFARGLRTGMRVSQGEVIGYVGQTGLASGPHLHYEFRVNDVQIDPLSTTVPVATTLDKQQQVAFREQSDRLQKALALQQGVAGSEQFE